MRKLLSGTALVAALAFVPSLVVAQGIRYGAGVGLLMPLGDYKTADKAGWVAGADVTKWLSGGMLGVRVEGSYSQTSEASGVGAHATKILGGMADLVYAFG